MTIPSDSQVFESYVPVYDVVPEDWKDARPFIVEQLKKLAIAVNIREIGWFLDEELLSGKAFIPGVNSSASGMTSQIYRQVLRKVIDFGALPAAGTKSVPHGISVTDNFTLVFMGGYATDPVNLVGIPIPFVGTTGLPSLIAINMNSTNINITVGTNRSTFTRCYVIIEYLQEV